MSRDLDAIVVLQAEHEVQTIEIITKHACLSDAALDRAQQALVAIRRALNVKRVDVRLQSSRHEAAA